MAKHFDWCDWEEAFAYFYKVHSPTVNPVCMVLSTHWVTSGYWVENNPQPTKNEEFIVYRTVEEVKGLEQRIKDKREEKAIYNELGLFMGYPASLGGVVT